jgi:hypothetical protein
MYLGAVQVYPLPVTEGHQCAYGVMVMVMLMVMIFAHWWAIT